MRKLKKFISVLMMIIILFGVTACFNNESKAATYLIKEAQLYSKGEMVSFKYQGTGIGVQFVVYEKDGVEYPAYCLDKTLIGVTTEQGVTIKVKKALEDVKIWRVITNGYPFKTPAELKCNSEAEAFAATKMAVYDTMYNYDWADFEALNEQGKRVIEAAESIAKIAEKSTETKITGEVEIKAVTEGWVQDDIEKEYVSKTYEVITNAESTGYTIQISATQLEGQKITDENNQEKSTFKNGEKFKILIPTARIESKIEVDRKIRITATADLKTKPILFGETSNSNYQDYAVVGGEWEFEKTTLVETYPPNKTCIKILKEDAETKEALEGAKFNIFDENKNLAYTDVTTNEEGIVEIIGVMPGKYYIEEVKSPDGYTRYEEIIEIELGFNENYTVNVNNYKKPQKEEKEIEDKEITVTSKQEVALPRTGF